MTASYQKTRLTGEGVGDDLGFLRHHVQPLNNIKTAIGRSKPANLNSCVVIRVIHDRRPTKNAINPAFSPVILRAVVSGRVSFARSCVV